MNGINVVDSVSAALYMVAYRKAANQPSFPARVYPLPLLNSEEKPLAVVWNRTQLRRALESAFRRSVMRGGEGKAEIRWPA